MINLTCCSQKLPSLPMLKAALLGTFPSVSHIDHERSHVLLLLYREPIAHIRAPLNTFILLDLLSVSYLYPVLEASRTCQSIRYSLFFPTLGAQHLSYTCFPGLVSPYVGEPLGQCRVKGIT